jgi:hypothetical protein
MSTTLTLQINNNGSTGTGAGQVGVRLWFQTIKTKKIELVKIELLKKGSEISEPFFLF